MDRAKLKITHYPISEFKNFSDMVYRECANLSDNWSTDESKSNSLAYCVKHRLTHFSITTYEDKFINFSGMYKYGDWVIGGVRGFSVEQHGIRVLKSIWFSSVFPAQYEFCKTHYSDCIGYMVTFNDMRTISLVHRYANRSITEDKSAVEFYKRCVFSKEPEIIQYTPQNTMKWSFE